MKRTLFVPVVLLLNTLLFSFLIGIPVALLQSDVELVLRYVGPIVVVALTAAVLVTTIRSIFKPIVPVLFVVLLFVTGSALLVGVLALDRNVLQPRTIDPGMDRSIPTGAILHGPDYSMIVGSATGVALEDLLVFRTREIPSIVRIDRAVWNARTMEIVSTDGVVRERYDAAELTGVEWRQLPLSLDRLAEQVVTIYTILLGSFRARIFLDFLVYGTALLLAVVAVWTPARLFRWPLLNLVVAIAYLRLVFAFPSILVDHSVASFLPQWVPSIIGTYLAPSAWAVGTVLLLIIAIALPTLSRWRREITGEAEA